MNDFCFKYCCGRNVQEVINCDDKNCPFYRNRRANLDYQNERKDAKKLPKNLDRS